MLDGPAADVFESQRFSTLGALIANGADQACATASCQWEHREKVRLIEVHVQFAIERRAAGLHISHIENLLVGPAGKSGVQGLAHD